MDIKFTKGPGEDYILVTRPDGSRVESRFPHKGLFPHDLVHLVVESAMGLTQGFWGLVERGKAPEELATMAREAGHASAKRAGIPDVSIIQLLQAERLVECFEADLWSGPSDPDNIRAAFEAGCAQSRVPALMLDDQAIKSIQATIAALHQKWSAVDVGQSLTLTWPYVAGP